ncbi:hypothetical protein [Aquisalimonas asiatica]|uniref:Uncharacterized protein n=1 Tax=Aquisalimonas asiatica TaxID=406100 RepID=A0A1H8TMY5_9GAMM|nr:hypothetical protein [Aquisalimonas asiatica]SEO92420.1 hypothetical protein SAMN04488052_104337 [Aquisalimonas asiatica]
MSIKTKKIYEQMNGKPARTGGKRKQGQMPDPEPIYARLNTPGGTQH